MSRLRRRVEDLEQATVPAEEVRARDERLREAMDEDPELRAFVDELEEATGGDEQACREWLELDRLPRETSEEGRRRLEGFRRVLAARRGGLEELRAHDRRAEERRRRLGH